MKNRPIYNTDLTALKKAIEEDKFHPGEWRLEHFSGFSECIEDAKGVVVFAHYDPEPGERLRISTLWTAPDEHYRNGRSIIFLVRSAAARAREVGFKELIFKTTHPPLARFCMRMLDFESIGENEYVLPITKEGSDVRTQ